MANVESMIVEEKPQTKQIDREKVKTNCLFCYQHSRFAYAFRHVRCC